MPTMEQMLDEYHHLLFLHPKLGAVTLSHRRASLATNLKGLIKCILMIGVCVWGEEFENESPYSCPESGLPGRCDLSSGKGASKWTLKRKWTRGEQMTLCECHVWGKCRNVVKSVSGSVSWIVKPVFLLFKSFRCKCASCANLDNLPNSSEPQFPQIQIQIITSVNYKKWEIWDAHRKCIVPWC